MKQHINNICVGPESITMLINVVVVCVILAVLQPGLKASEVSGDLQLLQQQLLEMQQQMDADRQHMQQVRETTDEIQLLKQLLMDMQQQKANAEREEMQRQMATEREALLHQMETERQQMQQETTNEIELLNQQLQKMQQQMTREREEMQQDIASQKEELVSQKEEIQNLTYKLESQIPENKSKQELSSYVSFTAYASDIRDYNEGDHVIFDATLRNYGSAYFVNVREFICPMNAYYMISISLLADSGGEMIYGMIMLDDEQLVVACARDDDLVGTTHASSSQTVVTYCAAGQRVWAKCHYGNNNRMFGSADAYSTFSATLLRVA